MALGMLLFARMHFTIMTEWVGHCCAKEANCLSHHVVASFLKSASMMFMSPIHRIHWSLFFLHAHMLGESLPVYINHWPTLFYRQLLQASWASMMISFISPCSDVLFQDHTETSKTRHQCRLVWQVEMTFSSQVVRLCSIFLSMRLYWTNCVNIFLLPKSLWRCDTSILA